MECNVPTDIVFSFSGLRQRGGRTAHHADGWGLALYDGRAARIFREPTPAAESPLARFVSENPIKTLVAIGHVRKRTRGKTTLANTHPFVRELWGRHWVFAHNGTVRDAKSLKLGRFQPIGNTDSERAYCHVLDGLRAEFRDYPSRPSDLHQAVADMAKRVGRTGTFNFLMSDSQHLFARCATKLAYIIRKAPFGRARLSDDDVTVDFAELTTPNDRVAIVSTVPLTCDEAWTIGEPGDLWVFRGGKLKRTLAA